MKNTRVIRTGFGLFLFGVLGFALFFYANFKTVEVRGPSMEPTFESGRHLLMSNAYWLVGQIRKNDIVVVKAPEAGETLIKRVKGLPGDVVDFMAVPHNWKLVNGEYKVPDGTLYVLGDNRPVSQDSRDFGPFEKSDVLGKIVVYGNEPWIMWMLVLAGIAILSSGIAAWIDSRQKATGQA